MCSLRLRPYDHRLDSAAFLGLVPEALVPEALAQEGGGGALPYMGYIGMCRCEGYGFQAVYSKIGYVNQSVWV